MIRIGKNETRAVKSLIGEDLKEKLNKVDLSDDRILHLYHKTGRHPKEFKKAIESSLDEREDILDVISGWLENTRKQLKQMKQVRRVLLMSTVRKTMEESE